MQRLPKWVASGLSDNRPLAMPDSLAGLAERVRTIPTLPRNC